MPDVAVLDGHGLNRALPARPRLLRPHETSVTAAPVAADAGTAEVAGA